MTNKKVLAKKTQVLKASSDQVWERLRKLDKIEEIVPTVIGNSWVDHNENPGIGSKRSCTLPGQGSKVPAFVEEVIEFDDSKRSYSYLVAKGTPAKNLVNSFKVLDLGYKKCEVIWQSTMDGFIENPEMSQVEFESYIKNGVGNMLMEGLVRLYN